MRLNYRDLIREASAELLRLEHSHRGGPLEARLKMLRLLQSGAYRSRAQVALVLGYTPRQLQRWWDVYRKGGLAALQVRGTPGGSRERITPEAWAALEEQMSAGRVAQLSDAQRFLKEQFGMLYSIGGLSDLMRRHKAKRKTGRRRHQKSSAPAQEAWKKKVRAGGDGPTAGPVLCGG